MVYVCRQYSRFVFSSKQQLSPTQRAGAVLRIWIFLLDPDPEFSPSDLDPDSAPALIIDNYPVLAYTNQFLTSFVETVWLKNKIWTLFTSFFMSLHRDPDPVCS
jgi:hypothetical protein